MLAQMADPDKSGQALTGLTLEQQAIGKNEIVTGCRLQANAGFILSL
jgi:hypothetical protein